MLIFKKMSETFFTITLGDNAENHHGMEMLPAAKSEIQDGFSWNDFISAIPIFKKWGATPELYPLDDWINDLETDTEYKNPAASVLVVRNGIQSVLQSQNIADSSHDMWFKELNTFEWDTKYYDVRRNKVLNKLARANVCFSDTAQIADYDNKKGTVIAWDSLPFISAVRNGLPLFLGKKAANLVGEGNRYENKKQGIGAHGDSERRKVAMWRIGRESFIGFRPYKNFNKIGRPLFLNLKGGDMLFMSEKACGWDWKHTKNNRITWRHAAGGKKYINQLK